MENFNLTVNSSTEYSVLDTGAIETAVAMGSVTAVTPAAQVNTKDLTKKALEKAAKAAAKAAEKAAIKAAAQAKETAIALAVKDALSKGSTIADKYEAVESDKVAFKDNSREATYGLLVEVMAYVEELDKRSDLSDVLVAMKASLWKNWKIKTQENTSDLGVIVKYITRTKRKNAHMYSRVLEQARKQNKNSSNLLEYITKCGGINKIVASSKANSLKDKTRLHNAYKRYAHASLVHVQHDGGLGKIPLTPAQINRHFDTRDNAHFVYTFGKIQNNELVVIDFVPWVSEKHESEFLLFQTLSQHQLLADGCGEENATEIIVKRMAAMFDKYNAGRIKRNHPTYNYLGEVASGTQTTDFSVFDWVQFEQEYAEYLAAKAITA